MKYFSSRVLIIVPVLLWFCGCMADLSPIEVSEFFWNAIKDDKPEVARKYVSSKSHNEQDLTENILPINNVSFGKIVIDGDKAWVDTTVVLAADEPFSLPLKTVLLRENNQWKVDYDATVSSVSRDSDVARVISGLSELSGKIARELDRSLEEIQKAIPEVQKELENIEEDINKALPEVRKKIEDIIEQIEEALKRKEKEKQQPSDDTIEI